MRGNIKKRLGREKGASDRTTRLSGQAQDFKVVAACVFFVKSQPLHAFEATAKKQGCILKETKQGFNREGLSYLRGPVENIT